MTGRWAVAVRLDPVADSTRSWMPEVVVDLIWARAQVADGLDHVRATTDLMDYPEIALIVRAASDADALQTATRLWAQVRSSPVLHGWTVRSVDVLPLADLMRAPPSSRNQT